MATLHTELYGISVVACRAPFPEWRFQTMFDALRSVVAGAIVALFGGVLLAAALATGPSDVVPPAAPASASATEGPRLEPDAEMRTSGGDLETEDVRPGIRRVVRDDEGRYRSVTDVTTGPDGAVVVLDGQDLRRVGGPSLPPPPIELHDVAIEHDGAVLGVGEGVAWYDGDGWERAPNVGWTIAVHRTVDGDLWAFMGDPEDVFDAATVSRLLETDPHGHVLGRLHDGSMDLFLPSQLGIPYGDILAFAETPGGNLWAGVGVLQGGVHGWPGLLRLDGRAWQPEQPFEPGTRFWTTGLVVAPDGTLWASFIRFDARDVRSLHLGRWDGDSWRVVAAPQGIGFTWAVLAVGPDGSVWLHAKESDDEPRVSTVFDGSTWRMLDIPAGTRDIAVAEDGGVWMVAGDGSLYTVDPELALVGAPSSDLLPGVDLVTEEVEPGVYKVINDGVRDLARANDLDIVAGHGGGV